jgi:hypothetical protein
MDFGTGNLGSKADKNTAKGALAIHSFVGPGTDSAYDLNRDPDLATKGPAGGIIFSINGDIYKEVTPLTGAYNWQDAQQAASDLTSGGYNDWYAPSKDELNEIYINNIITSGSYWSATASSAMNAWDQNLETGRQGEKGAKSSTKSALAIRAYKKLPGPQAAAKAPFVVGNLGSAGVIYFKSGSTCKEVFVLNGTYKWADAKTAAADLVAGGNDDWKAPTDADLQAIYDAKILTAGNYWSGDETNALNGHDFRFNTGAAGTKADKSTARGALAVRELVDPNVAPPKVGDTGPGGGTIYAINGNQVSELVILPGTYKWADAKAAATKYVGNGIGGWKAPTDKDLQAIYDSQVLTSGNYWSADDTNALNAHDFRFASGASGTKASKSSDKSALAIRTFTK